jgi:hypothetical protein
MALRRDTARHLNVVMRDEHAFVQAVAVEIETKRIKPKVGERLIIAWYQDRDWLWRQLEIALFR